MLKQSRLEGRWLSPDPAGLAAVDLTNPQTWKRYAYVGNMPLTAVDPLGLEDCEAGSSDSGCANGGTGGGYDPFGYCPPDHAFCGDDDVWEPGSGGFGGGLPGAKGILPGENSINFPVDNIAQPIIDILSGGIPNFSPWGMPTIPGYNGAPVIDSLIRPDSGNPLGAFMNSLLKGPSTGPGSCTSIFWDTVGQPINSLRKAVNDYLPLVVGALQSAPTLAGGFANYMRAVGAITSTSAAETAQDIAALNMAAAVAGTAAPLVAAAGPYAIAGGMVGNKFLGPGQGTAGRLSWTMSMVGI